VDSTRLNVLVVDEVPEVSRVVSEALATEPLQVLLASGWNSAIEQFEQARPRIVLAGLGIEGRSGLELMDHFLASDPGVDFVLMGEWNSPEMPLEAIRRGAYDCLSKPLQPEQIRRCVRTLIEQAIQRARTLQMEQELLRVYQFEGMIGRSPVMLEVFRKIRRIAPHFRTVMVTGATGTGKELVARALHNLSPAKSAPFAVCNCSALVETLLESELFGYVKGAFTGAARDKQGVFEYANGGTVFLDEIGELPLSAQAKLLRVLQNQEVQRVGSPVAQRVDVRIIAATHRDLRKMVADGHLREDLFYRLSVVEIPMPRLAERKEDLPLLLRHFLKVYSALFKKEVLGLTRRAQLRLVAHSWPGNVRELENIISSSCIMAVGKVIDLPDLPETFRLSPPAQDAQEEELLTLEQMQLRHLVRVLNSVHGNKARAAEILGVGRNTIYHMLSRWRASSEGHSQGGGGDFLRN
jgi:DNA-binding NtrC family response regulator